jgi:hypothetical protein
MLVDVGLQIGLRHHGIYPKALSFAGRGRILL